MTWQRESRVDVDGTMLHVDPGEIVSSIAYEFADSRVRKADCRSYTYQLSPRYFFVKRSTLFMVIG